MCMHQIAAVDLRVDVFKLCAMPDAYLLHLHSSKDALSDDERVRICPCSLQLEAACEHIHTL
jgi:hypothetical protein